MKIPSLATAAALFGTAIILHGQEVAVPDANPTSDSKAPETTAADRSAEDAPLGADRDQEYRDLKAKLEQWEGADSEQIPLSEVPDVARQTARTVADGAEIEDQVNVYTKDDMQVYAIQINPEDQKHIKLFVKADGGVELAKQATTMDDAPEVVARTFEQHVGNQSPDEMYRVVAQATTAYIAIVKGDDDQVRIITVGNNGRHIDTQTMDKVSDQDE